VRERKRREIRRGLRGKGEIEREGREREREGRERGKGDKEEKRGVHRL